MISKVYVGVFLPGTTLPVIAGRLDFDDNPESQIYSFRYSANYLKLGRKAVPLDPERLPLIRAQKFESPDLFGALGVFRDAAPDDWGRRVIEKRLGKTEASEITYLVQAGDDRVGALAFTESLSRLVGRGLVPDETDLKDLLRAASAIEQGLPVDSHLSTLLKQGSSLGGARPKATVRSDGELWLAKFPSTGDRLEIAAIEYACLTLARRCGIEVPEIRLVPVGSQRVMLTHRFDRDVAADGGFTRYHFMSGLTLLGLREREHSKGSYPDLADSMRKLVANFGKDGEELFRRMIFNMLVGNDDDHLRNHAVILDATGWRQSPAYDLVPHPQQSFTRQLGIGIGSEGRVASYKNALSEAGRFGLTRERAEQIAAAVLHGVRDWETVFREAGVSRVDIEAVRPAFLPESVVSGFRTLESSARNHSESINPAR